VDVIPPFYFWNQTFGNRPTTRMVEQKAKKPNKRKRTVAQRKAGQQQPQDTPMFVFLSFAFHFIELKQNFPSKRNIQNNLTHFHSPHKQVSGVWCTDG
jgi:alpha-acetolactate decarboxylase